PLTITANQTREQFEAAVRTIQEHIAAGDIYQAVLSQRFETASLASPFDVYRALRHINPSPYMYFIRMGAEAIIGASPEMLVRVEGKLDDHADRLDALQATFPAGTLTGAPKIRAMQIIGGLEPTRRGLYGGAVGYLDFAGNLDFCIAIRTITMRGQRAEIQAG